MPENMTFGLGDVVVFVRYVQFFCLTLLESRRRSGRTGASRDIGATGHDASEVDASESGRRPTVPFPEFFAISS